MQRFVWDGDQMVYEVRARGDSAAFSLGVEDGQLDDNGIYGAINAYGRVGYTHAGGIDRPIGAVRGTTPFYPHTNSRGLYENATIDNGTLLTNGVAWPGQSASAYLGWTPPSRNEWFGSLVTEQADASGLLYRRNRYYDPKVGRFTQPDPIGIAGGLNSYGFANGDPVNFSDPFGLNPCFTPPVATYCLAAVAAAGAATTAVLMAASSGEDMARALGAGAGAAREMFGNVLVAMDVISPDMLPSATKMGKISQSVGKWILVGLGVLSPDGPKAVPMDVRDVNRRGRTEQESKPEKKKDRGSGEPPKRDPENPQ